MRVHARRVGVAAGEQLEGAECLADVHVTAVHRAASDTPRRLQNWPQSDPEEPVVRATVAMFGLGAGRPWDGIMHTSPYGR